MAQVKGSLEMNGPPTPSLRSSMKESAKSSSKMKRSRQPSFSSSSNVNVASQRYMKGLAAGTMMGEIQTLGDSGRRKLLHHSGRVKAERKMIETFNTLDYHHDKQNSSIKDPVQDNDDAVSVRSRRSSKSGAVLVSCSPGRYSLGRFIED